MNRALDELLPGRIRVGCDVVAVSDIEHSVSTFGDRFLTKIFSAGEVAHCAGRTHQLAARFAAKEAVIKAFAAPDEAFVPPEIEIVAVRGVPTLRLHGSAAALARRQGWDQWAVSLSHADCHATATVAVVCTQSV